MVNLSAVERPKSGLFGAVSGEENYTRSGWHLVMWMNRNSKYAHKGHWFSSPTEAWEHFLPAQGWLMRCVGLNTQVSTGGFIFPPRAHSTCEMWEDVDVFNIHSLWSKSQPAKSDEWCRVSPLNGNLWSGYINLCRFSKWTCPRAEANTCWKELAISERSWLGRNEQMLPSALPGWMRWITADKRCVNTQSWNFTFTFFSSFSLVL